MLLRLRGPEGAAGGPPARLRRPTPPSSGAAGRGPEGGRRDLDGGDVRRWRQRKGEFGSGAGSVEVCGRGVVFVRFELGAKINDDSYPV